MGSLARQIKRNQMKKNGTLITKADKKQLKRAGFKSPEHYMQYLLATGQLEIPSNEEEVTEATVTEDSEVELTLNVRDDLQEIITEAGLKK